MVNASKIWFTILYKIDVTFKYVTRIYDGETEINFEEGQY